MSTKSEKHLLYAPLSGSGLKKTSSSNWEGLGSNNSDYEFCQRRTFQLTTLQVVVYWHGCTPSFASFSQKCSMTLTRKCSWVFEFRDELKLFFEIDGKINFLFGWMMRNGSCTLPIWLTFFSSWINLIFRCKEGIQSENLWIPWKLSWASWKFGSERSL